LIDRWRTVAVVIDRQGHDRLAILRDTLAAFADLECEPVVLKGMPLSQRLYGDPFVRASDDIDLFIRPAMRAAARRALTGAGWIVVDGAPPWDEVLTLPRSPGAYLEVHERLVTDYLAHVALPDPAIEAVFLDDVPVASISGAMEPAYLAAHLAGHQLAPLLWGIDFLTMWERADRDSRDQALAAASGVGLQRYLGWAIAYASDIDLAAEGDALALDHLGVQGDNRSDRHFSVWRHASLAATPGSSIRAVGACLWPRPIRWDVKAFAARVGWRVGYRGRRAGARAERGPSTKSAANLAVGRGS
jgi:hypothetical protein